MPARLQHWGGACRECFALHPDCICINYAKCSDRNNIDVTEVYQVDVVIQTRGLEMASRAWARPPMRRKCHLIIIQIDPIWVISFWERGSFGISLVY